MFAAFTAWLALRTTSVEAVAAASPTVSSPFSLIVWVPCPLDTRTSPPVPLTVMLPVLPVSAPVTVSNVCVPPAPVWTLTPPLPELLMLMSPCSALNVCTPAGPVDTVRRPFPPFVMLMSSCVAVKVCVPDAFTVTAVAPPVTSMPLPVTDSVPAVMPAEIATAPVALSVTAPPVPVVVIVPLASEWMFPVSAAVGGEGAPGGRRCRHGGHAGGHERGGIRANTGPGDHQERRIGQR